MIQAQTEQIIETKEPKCKKAHSCLSGEQDCRCRVVQLVDEAILAVSPPPEMTCSHKMRYRDGFLCTCNVRRETYRRYRV